MKSKQTCTQKEKQPWPPHEDEYSGLTPEEQRERLAQKIFRIINEMEGAPNWCRVPVCKRSRRCAHPARPCEADAPPKPEISEEEAAENLFQFKKALEARVAHYAALREAKEDSAAPTAKERSSATRRARSLSPLAGRGSG